MEKPKTKRSFLSKLGTVMASATSHNISSSAPPSVATLTAPIVHPIVREVTEDTPPDLLEGTMDINVVLPSGKTMKMTILRKTPMMDLLIQVATANKINPGGHIVQVKNERGFELPYKPSTPIGALDTTKIEIVPKNKVNEYMIVKKPAKVANQPFETTFRLQVHLPRNQLYVLRASAKTVLEDILQEVCEEKNLDVTKYEIRHPANYDQKLPLSNCLGDYGIQEVRVVSKSSRISNSVSAADIMALHTVDDMSKNKTALDSAFKHSRSSVGDSSLSSESATSKSDDSRSLSPLPVIPRGITNGNTSHNLNRLSSVPNTPGLGSNRMSGQGLPRPKKRAAPPPPVVTPTPVQNPSTPVKPAPRKRIEAPREPVTFSNNEDLSRQNSIDNQNETPHTKITRQTSISSNASGSKTVVASSNLTSVPSVSSTSLVSNASGGQLKKRKAPRPPTAAATPSALQAAREMEEERSLSLSVGMESSETFVKPVDQDSAKDSCSSISDSSTDSPPVRNVDVESKSEVVLPKKPAVVDGVGSSTSVQQQISSPSSSASKNAQAPPPRRKVISPQSSTENNDPPKPKPRKTSKALGNPAVSPIPVVENPVESQPKEKISFKKNKIAQRSMKSSETAVEPPPVYNIRNPLARNAVKVIPDSVVQERAARIGTLNDVNNDMETSLSSQSYEQKANNAHSERPMLRKQSKEKETYENRKQSIRKESAQSDDLIENFELFDPTPGSKSRKFSTTDSIISTASQISNDSSDSGNIQFLPSRNQSRGLRQNRKFISHKKDSLISTSSVETEKYEEKSKEFYSNIRNSTENPKSSLDTKQNTSIFNSPKPVLLKNLNVSTHFQIGYSPKISTKSKASRPYWEEEEEEGESITVGEEDEEIHSTENDRAENEQEDFHDEDDYGGSHPHSSGSSVVSHTDSGIPTTTNVTPSPVDLNVEMDQQVKSREKDNFSISSSSLHSNDHEEEHWKSSNMTPEEGIVEEAFAGVLPNDDDFDEENGQEMDGICEKNESLVGVDRTELKDEERLAVKDSCVQDDKLSESLNKDCSHQEEIMEEHQMDFNSMEKIYDGESRDEASMSLFLSSLPVKSISYSSSSLESEELALLGNSKPFRQLGKSESFSHKSEYDGKKGKSRTGNKLDRKTSKQELICTMRRKSCSSEEDISIKAKDFKELRRRSGGFHKTASLVNVTRNSLEVGRGNEKDVDGVMNLINAADILQTMKKELEVQFEVWKAEFLQKHLVANSPEKDADEGEEEEKIDEKCEEEEEKELCTEQETKIASENSHYYVIGKTLDPEKEVGILLDEALGESADDFDESSSSKETDGDDRKHENISRKSSSASSSSSEMRNQMGSKAEALEEIKNATDNSPSDSEERQQSAKWEENKMNVQNSHSGEEAAVPLTYRYTGPPSIKINTWKENPQRVIKVKEDSDYVIGIGQHDPKSIRSSEINKGVAEHQYKRTYSSLTRDPISVALNEKDPEFEEKISRKLISLSASVTPEREMHTESAMMKLTSKKGPQNPELKEESNKNVNNIVNTWQKKMEDTSKRSVLLKGQHPQEIDIFGYKELEKVNTERGKKGHIEVNGNNKTGSFKRAESLDSSEQSVVIRKSITVGASPIPRPLSFHMGTFASNTLPRPTSGKEKDEVDTTEGMSIKDRKSFFQGVKPVEYSEKETIPSAVNLKSKIAKMESVYNKVPNQTNGLMAKCAQSPKVIATSKKVEVMGDGYRSLDIDASKRTIGQVNPSAGMVHKLFNGKAGYGSTDMVRNKTSPNSSPASTLSSKSSIDRFSPSPGFEEPNTSVISIRNTKSATLNPNIHSVGNKSIIVVNNNQDQKPAGIAYKTKETEAKLTSDGNDITNVFKQLEVKKMRETPKVFTSSKAKSTDATFQIANSTSTKEVATDSIQNKRKMLLSMSGNRQTLPIQPNIMLVRDAKTTNGAGTESPARKPNELPIKKMATPIGKEVTPPPPPPLPSPDEIKNIKNTTSLQSSAKKRSELPTQKSSPTLQSNASLQSQIVADIKNSNGNFKLRKTGSTFLL